MNTHCHTHRPLCVWECSENPKHRGWREWNVPRGSCDYCLAITAFEREVVPTGTEERPTDCSGPVTRALQAQSRS